MGEIVNFGIKKRRRAETRRQFTEPGEDRENIKAGMSGADSFKTIEEAINKVIEKLRNQ